jgi:hypothetical protein
MVPMDAWGLGPDLYRSMRHWKLLAKAWPAWRQIPILSFRLKPSVRLKSWTRATKRSRSTCAVESLWRVVSYYWIFTESASATVAATFSLFQHVEFALDRFQSRSIHTCMHALHTWITFTLLFFALHYFTLHTLQTHIHTFITYIDYIHTYMHYITLHHIISHYITYITFIHTKLLTYITTYKHD